jgi:hypothetical protein
MQRPVGDVVIMAIKKWQDPRDHPETANSSGICKHQTRFPKNDIFIVTFLTPFLYHIVFGIQFLRILQKENWQGTGFSCMAKGDALCLSASCALLVILKGWQRWQILHYKGRCRSQILCYF